MVHIVAGSLATAKHASQELDLEPLAWRYTPHFRSLLGTFAGEVVLVDGWFDNLSEYDIQGWAATLGFHNITYVRLFGEPTFTTIEQAQQWLDSQTRCDWVSDAGLACSRRADHPSHHARWDGMPIL